MASSCMIPLLATVLCFTSTGTRLRIRAPEAGDAGDASDSSHGCPMDFDVPDDQGKPSSHHLASVANFLEPKIQDRWWTESKVAKYDQPMDTFKIGISKIA